MATVCVKYVGYNIRVLFLCCSYHAFSYIPYFNQQKAPNKIHHKTHLILGNKPSVFQHWGVIFREMIINEGVLSPTGTSSACHPHFHHHAVYCPLYTLTWYMLCTWARRDPFGSYVHFHTTHKIYTTEKCNRRGLLLYVVVISAVWTCAS
jgi:hypothetical protein